MPKASPLTLSLDLASPSPTVDVPVSRAGLSAAVWTAVSVWQRVAFPLWEGRLAADEDPEGELLREATSTGDEVRVGKVYGFTCLPVGGDAVLSMPDRPGGEEAVQVAYLDVQVSFWDYRPAGGEGGAAETSTLLATVVRVVLDRNRRPARFGIDGGRGVEAVRGTAGTDKDGTGIYDEFDVGEAGDDGEEDDELEIEDAMGGDGGEDKEDRPKGKL